MIKTSIKFSILVTLLFVLINIVYIQPETKANSGIRQEQSAQVEATPVNAPDQEAVVIPIVDTIGSTRAVNTPSQDTTALVTASMSAAPAATAANSNGTTTTNSSTEVKLLEAGALLGAFRATAYCLRGRTASGSGVRRGIVAADPRVLPLGSRIQIEGAGYTGTYTVADTGGAIKGRILDVWVPSCSEAMRFGRRTLKVTLLSRGGGRAKKKK